MGQDRLEEQVVDLLARRLAAYQQLLDISSKQYDSVCRGDMDEFDAHAKLQDDLISRINQFDSELNVLISNDSFQETQMFREFMIQTDECMHKLQELYQEIQRVLREKCDEIGKELLMLKNRSRVLNSYKQGGTLVL